MATRSLTRTNLPAGTSVALLAWTGLANGDVGEAFECLDFADLNVTVEGTFGAGGTIVLKGSNDGTNYYTLTDPQGNAISKTAAATEAVVETPRYIRPEVTAGDGSTSLQCRILARRGSR